MGDGERRRCRHEMRKSGHRHLVTARHRIGCRGGVGVRRASGGVPDCCRSPRRGAGARNVKLGQGVGVLLVSRLSFQNDAVLVGLPVDRGDLPLAERIVERVRDALHRDTEPAGLLTIDLDLHARPTFLSLRCNFAESGISAQTAHQFVGPLDHLGAVGGHQRVLVLCAANAGRNLYVLGCLEIHGHAGYPGNCVL